MARTLTTLRTNVRVNIGNPPSTVVSDSWLDRAINASYLETVSRYRHPEIETQETIATVAGTATDALPSDYWYTKSIRDETNDRVLKYRNLDWILAQDRDTNGEPKYFTQWGTNLIFHPIPDAVYSLTHYYATEVTALSAGGDTTVVNNYWDEIIEWGATWRLHQYSQEMDKMVHARNIWRTLVNSMPETKVLTAEQSQQIAGLMMGPVPAENTE